MNVIEKISKLRQPGTDTKHDLVYGGRVTKVGAVRQMPTKCSVCDKEFSVNDKKINYFYDLSAAVHLICDKCYQKFIDAYTVVSCERIEPFGGYMAGGTAHNCKMKDGSIRSFPYGGNDSVYGEIPKIFHDTIRPFVKKYYDDLAAKEIKDLTIEDTYDKQVIHVEFNSGKKYDVNFKIGTSGNIIYNPADMKKLSDEEISKINDKLRDLGYYNHKI